ncbi:TraB/GumN family protein [Hyphomicrobium sp. LHD-15]|uniref:TraB/GumN family protein n=1 Tax=Hyphomicrobium sp. LHD-15 TaxID=3072142 RepID=UPI00280DEEEF|nr:TraB/GumN family protein [Hyphomicrobium sp. LHD-15]MDQ8698891.1 TraB/GumN family protein [Hyphomicrobium sp. LHD-15]
MATTITTLLLSAATVLVLVSAFAPSSSYAAQPGACDGSSLIAELALKRPAGLTSLLENASKAENSQAVLWRIERNGTSPSFVLGTLHIAHSSLQELSPAIKSAIAASRVVALEQEQLSRGAYGQVMAQAGKLMSARDKPLQRMLDESELKVVEKAISAAGYPEDLALGVRPWVATLFLAGGCPHETHEPMDLIVANFAKSHGKQILGLETLLEQFETLAAIPDEAQAAWLRASIEMNDRADDVTVTMLELYRDRQIAASLDIMRELAPNAGLTDARMQDIRHGLITDRNMRMAQRGMPLFEAGGAFVAVGATHLPGSDGLISILKSNGFTVTPVE